LRTTDGNEPFLPTVLVESVKIDGEALRAVAESRPEPQTLNGRFSSGPGGIYPNQLDIFLLVLQNVNVLHYEYVHVHPKASPTDHSGRASVVAKWVPFH
jgi:hypothetical protein